MPKKCILILLDGLGDRSYEELMHQTPLQAAQTPVLDKLAAMGASGLYHAADMGQALPSENAHFSMFGYDMACFPGRGALEAIGAGIELDPKDVAVLAHFASVSEQDGHLVLEKSKPKASHDEIKALIHAAGDYDKDGVSIRFNRTRGISGIITFRGTVSPFVTDTDPMMEGRPLAEIKPWQCHDRETAARNTSKALKAYLIRAYHRLKEHPVNLSRKKEGLPPLNALVTQRAGQLKKVTPFSEKYGLSGLSISSGIVYWGICAYIGLDAQKVADTEEPGRDMTERLTIARESLDRYDFIHVHTKAPDEAAHGKNPLAKKAVIESLDKGIGEAIRPLMDDPEVLVIVTADHSTPSSGPLIHSGEPVPLTFYGRGVRRDNVHRFDEISAATGALGCIRGRELMYLILNNLDRSKLYGIMNSPVDQPFWPGNYEPFKVE
jgi:2,3-bisphosphoglycerate-independent phosphoglycerate mutase